MRAGALPNVTGKSSASRLSGGRTPEAGAAVTTICIGTSGAFGREDDVATFAAAKDVTIIPIIRLCPIFMATKPPELWMRSRQLRLPASALGTETAVIKMPGLDCKNQPGGFIRPKVNCLQISPLQFPARPEKWVHASCPALFDFPWILTVETLVVPRPQRYAVRFDPDRTVAVEF